MIKVIWGLTGLYTIGLIIFILYYFVLNNGRHVAPGGEGYSDVFVCLWLVIILLAAVPLRYSQSIPVVIFCGFFAALPLAIFTWGFINKEIRALDKNKTYAQTYYEDKAQRRIAAAIENNDTIKLSQLIKGQDVNIKGKSIWGGDGLNYLQFAIILRSSPIAFPFNDEANTAAIKILIAHGAATTPALAEATKYLPTDKLLLLLNAGAKPDLSVPGNVDPLLFQVISNDMIKTDIAVVLIQKGASINIIKDSIYTPVMYAAYLAGTLEYKKDTWRLVRYLLEEAHADFIYTAKNGLSLGSIIQNIRLKAKEESIVMPPDFGIVVTWLKERNILTDTIS